METLLWDPSYRYCFKQPGLEHQDVSLLFVDFELVLSKEAQMLALPFKIRKLHAGVQCQLLPAASLTGHHLPLVPRSSMPAALALILPHTCQTHGGLFRGLLPQMPPLLSPTKCRLQDSRPSTSIATLFSYLFYLNPVYMFAC